MLTETNMCLLPVRRHVLRSHDAADFTEQCSRCRVWFKKKAFKTHKKNQGCLRWQPPAVDKYDKGITEAMATSLRERRVKCRVLTWKALCDTIFPETQDNIVSGKCSAYSLYIGI